MFSGLPGAGATMRTVINVKSGGSTPISGMVHSVVLLIVLVGAGPLAAPKLSGPLSINSITSHEHLSSSAFSSAGNAFLA